MGSYVRPAESDIRPLVLRLCWVVLGFGCLFALARWNDAQFLIFIDRFLYSLKDYRGYTPPFLLPGIFIVPSVTILVFTRFTTADSLIERTITISPGLLIYKGKQRLEFPAEETTIKKDVPNMAPVGAAIVAITAPIGGELAVSRYKFQIRNESLKRSITIYPDEYSPSDSLLQELLNFEKECLDR